MNLDDPGASAAALVNGHRDVHVARVAAADLGALSHELATAHSARLADLFVDERPGHPPLLRAIYALDAEQRYLTLECEADGSHFPPLSDLDPAAFVEECEIYEQHGLAPDNGRALNRVLMPPHRAGSFPKLGHGASRRLARDYQPQVVSGEAFEFPFGPVRAAGWESLYTGLVTTGEEVLDLFLFQWHKHRGTERRLEGLAPERAVFTVERTEGLSAAGNAVAFCRAVEAAASTPVPPPAAHTRAVALELERVYNHAAAIAAMCQATSLSVGQARAEIVLEQLLRCNLAAFGHRYLFGIICPGGVTRAPDAHEIRAQLPAILEEFHYVAGALLATNSHVDRLEATGVIPPDAARRLSLVGPVARASGQAIDTRRDHPLGDEDEPAPDPVTREDGDALARMRVMIHEVTTAGRLIDIHLDRAGSGQAPVEPGESDGLGWAESARGESLAWVSLQADGRVRRARLRPASVRNWRAFDDAARSQNVFTDIPIIEASLWLTAAGFAR